MIAAIVILILLALLDVVLFVACVELEKEREVYEQDRKKPRRNIHND